MKRLCEVTYPEAGKETYTYDAVGNRVEKKVRKTSENPAQEYTEQYRYDERNRLTEKSVWENGATVPTDTTTYTYDAQGCLLREQGTDFCRKYLYNDFHQCIRTEVIRGREEEAECILQENRYDGEGLRFSLIENGRRTDFITNDWENLSELDENGQVTKRIIRGMGIVASEDAEVSSNVTEATGNIIDATVAFTGTAYHYYHGNERMDVEYITDGAGQVVNGYTYDAFGTIITSSEKLQNRYTYNGEAFDKTTEQYYLRKRFYNPKLSRFIQEDEYRGDGLNLYAFCANNPVMYVDPSGYASTYDPKEYIDPSALSGLSATQKKNTPGIVTGTFTSNTPIIGNNIRSSDLTTIAIPQEVAKQLVGKQFSSFDELKGEIYKAIAKSSYASEFKKSNQTLMDMGQAPVAPSSLQTGKNYNQKKYNIHHVNPVEDGGDVYNLDNLAIVAPKTHNEIHAEIDAEKKEKKKASKCNVNG